MGKFVEASINRTGNTLAIAPRTAGTVVTTAADLFTTLKTRGKESAEIMADTSQKMKNTLINTWTEKTGNVKKAIKIAVSPIVAGVAGLEGIGRAFFQPIINGVSNTRNTGKNTVKNARRSTFGRLFSKKPISDFSFDNLSTRNLNLKNSTSSWRLSGNDSSTTSSDKEAKKSSSSRWPKSSGGSRRSKDNGGSRWSKSKEKDEKKIEKKDKIEQKTQIKKESTVDKKMETFDKDNQRGKDNIKKKDEEIKSLKKEIEKEKNKNKKQKKDIDKKQEIKKENNEEKNKGDTEDNNK